MKKAQQVKSQILSFVPPTNQKLKLEVLETGYLTRQLRRHIESLKVTACVYNQTSLASIQTGGLMNIFVQLNNIDQITQFDTKSKIKRLGDEGYGYFSTKAMPHYFSVYINAKVIQISQMEQYIWEENINFPILKAFVRRFDKIKFTHMDNKGIVQQSQLEGIDALVFQNNVQKLKGRTLIDFKSTAGHIELKNQFVDIPQCQHLKKLLQDYKEIGDSCKQDNPDYFEYSLEDLQVSPEVDNQRVQLYKKQEAIQLSGQIKEIQDLIQQEVEYLSEYFELPKKRKIQKRLQEVIQQ